MKPLILLYVASVKEFLRDRIAMFWILAFPVLFIFIFGIVFSDGENPIYDVGLAAEDRGSLGKALAKVFESAEAFNVTLGNQAELIAKFKKGNYRLVIVIPEGVSANLDKGQASRIKIYYDPTNVTTARVVLNIVQKVVESFDRKLTNTPTLLTKEMISLTSNRLRHIDFLLPGILGMALLHLGLFGTAPQLVQLREPHILRRLGATPLRRSTLLASQVLHRITIGFAQTIIIILVGTLVFHVTIVGNPVLLAGFALLGALMFVAMGYLVSGLAKTQESVIGVSQLINFPMMFLSGLFFPIDTMPDWIRPVVHAIPLTYLVDALRHIIVDSPSKFGLGLDAAILVGWLGISAILAVRLFRWE